MAGRCDEKLLSVNRVSKHPCRNSVTKSERTLGRPPVNTSQPGASSVLPWTWPAILHSTKSPDAIGQTGCEGRVSTCGPAAVPSLEDCTHRPSTFLTHSHLTSPPPAHTGAIPQPPRSRQCSPTAGHLHLSSTLSCYCFWPGGQLWAAQVCWPHQPHRAWSDPLYHMSNHVAPTSPQHPLAPTSCHVSVRAPSSHALFPPTGQSWLPLLLGSRGYPLREGAAPGQPFQTPACSLSPL